MIDSFTGDYRFLSNFHFARMNYMGLWWPTSEHPYQALKTINRPDRQYIASLPTPGMAKRAGRKLTIRPDWEQVKLVAMLGVVRAKFEQHPELADLLCETGDVELVEGNTWGDTYWGVCDGVGQNQLGKTLMLVRKELQCKRMFP